MRIKITKREILFFVAGVFVMLLIQMICDRDSFINDFWSGYNYSTGQSTEEIVK